MARVSSGLVFIGIKGSVIALDRRTGTEAWRASLPGSGFVCVFRDDDLLFATTSGEVFCLEPTTGTMLWHNPLKGFGRGFTSVAGNSSPASANLVSKIAAQVAQQQQAAGAAAG